MKKIYLLSGPGTKEGFSKKILEELNTDLKDAKSITFIASSPSNHDKNLKFIYGSENIIGMINHLKLIHTFEKINVIDDLNKNKNVIINSDVVYLLGGNHESQLKFIKENNLGEVLKEFDGILLCTSCGAMNIAEKGYYSKDENVSDSYFYDGIGLINRTIDPHFDINNEGQVNEALKMSSNHIIYGVPNDSGIKVEKGILKLIGTIYIFEDGNMRVGE